MKEGEGRLKRGIGTVMTSRKTWGAIKYRNKLIRLVLYSYTWKDDSDCGVKNRLNLPGA